MAQPLIYSDKIKEVSSEKVLLVWVEPFKRALTWTLDSGSIYKRSSEYVVGVIVNDIALTEASSEVLSAGEFYYDAENKEIYTRLSDDSDPEESFTVLKLRYFFSDRPTIATHNLEEDGVEVEYQGLLINNPTFPKEIDPATQLGIALESKGGITLENSNGFFDPIFDRLFWNNKRVVIYSWLPILPMDQKRKIFEGDIEDKFHSPSDIKFSITDQISRIKKEIKLGTYQLTDGKISDDVIGKPKRRLYGTVKGLVPQSVDQVLSGYSLTGTISGTEDGETVSGVGTDFINELSPEDELEVVLAAETISVTVDKILSATSFTVAFGLDKSFVGSTATILPSIPNRNFNRKFNIAGHKLREPSTTVTNIIQNNRLQVADISDFFAGDSIDINGVPRFIRRVTGNVLVLNQSLPSPSLGQSVIKNPINKVVFNQRELIIDRDYTIQNTTECTITLNSLAEFNQTVGTSGSGGAVFTNGSRIVNGNNTSFLSQFKPRDWIISGDITHQVWYEVLQVNDDDELEIREVYVGADVTDTFRKKNMKYIGDESILIVDCIGKEAADGSWIKTASDVIKDLVVNDAELTDIDTDSFDQAKEEAPFVMSLKLPLTKNGSAPLSRDAINLVNKSVFGSLISKNDFSIAYNVLYPEKPVDLTELNDDDLTSDPKFQSRTKIYSKIVGLYNHFDADPNTLEAGAADLEYDNSFVNKLIGTGDTLNVDIYLSESDDADTIAQRYGLYYSLTQSLISVTTDLSLALSNLGDKIFIALDRLFFRFGAQEARKKIGIITKLEKSGTQTKVTFSDIANIFDRVANIADDDSNEFTLASDNEKIKNGYIVDDDTELPSSEEDSWNTNLIG